MREALLSSLQRCVGSFPSQLLRYLWTFSKKSQRLREEGKGKNGGLADLLTRMSAGICYVVEVQIVFYCFPHVFAHVISLCGIVSFAFRPFLIGGRFSRVFVSWQSLLLG